MWIVNAVKSDLRLSFRRTREGYTEAMRPITETTVVQLLYGLTCLAEFSTVNLTHYMTPKSSSSSSGFILLQPFEIAIQTTYKKQITWNGNNGRTLRDRNPAN